MMIRMVGRGIAALAFVVLGAACRDAPTAPTTGGIRVTTHTSGGDPDVDGYRVVVSTDPGRLILTSATLVIAQVAAGPQIVTLDEVAENCTVTDGPSRAIIVPGGQTVNVSFDIVCATTGLEIRIRTAGVDMPHSFRVMVNSDQEFTMRTDTSIIRTRLQPGSYTIALAQPIDNCTVVGGRQVTVSVAAGHVVPVVFQIACTAAIRLEKIAFTFDTTTAADGAVTWIALVNPDGTGKTPLVRGDSPAWSRGGINVVFSNVTCKPGDYYYYYYDNCLGGLAFVDPEIGNDSTLAQGKDGLGPAWSPTSDDIAFWTASGVFLLEPGGARPARLPLPVVRARDPAWAPDGRRIALACTGPFDVQELCIYDTAGPVVGLPTPAKYASHPAWSPDGKTIAFTADAWVAVLDVGSGNVTVLTHGLEPSWSRDGRKLVFADDTGLFIINADGSNRIRLTTGAHHAPAWRP